jgi:cytochrome c-type biogenesis protein CcmE
MTRKQRRLAMISAGLGVLGVAAGLVLWAFSGSIRFFNSPTDLVENHVAPGTRIRLGGLVVPGSVVRENNLKIRFEVSDGNRQVLVNCAAQCAAALPDLFREGQGVVTDGTLDSSGSFTADTVLAKHDERYMPRDVADALKKQGHWKDDYAAKPSPQAGSRAGAEPGAQAGATTRKTP